MADSHVHLHAYGESEVRAMLGRAAGAGVGRVVAVSVDLESARRSLALAQLLGAGPGGSAPAPPGFSRERATPRGKPLGLPSVVVAVGLHPAHLTAVPGDDEWLALEGLVERAAAIGECGVDAEGPTSGLVQLAVFARHCRLAARTGKALLMHLVGEALVGPALGTLAATGVPRGRAVAHYFQGDRFEANRLLEAGVLISVGKPLTRLPHLRDALREVPLDALLLETDTYPLPGRTTEPADVRLVAEAVAEVKGMSVEEVAEATSRNLERLLVGGAAGG